MTTTTNTPTTTAPGSSAEAGAAAAPRQIPSHTEPPKHAGDGNRTSSDATNRVAHRRQAHVEKAPEFGADYLFLTYIPRDHWVRRQLIQLVTHRYFDRVIVLAILANSVILGIWDFSVVNSDLNPASTGAAFRNGVVERGVTSLANLIADESELPFTIIFTVECVMKIVAMGFGRQKGSYLRDSWNVLDFIVVISSWVGYILAKFLASLPNVSMIRVIRVLRPLRSLSMIPGMRRLITALLKALPALGNVVILQLFVFTIFGVLGIQLFCGSMNRRCRLTEFPVRLPIDDLHQHAVWPVPDEYLSAVLDNPKLYECLPGEPLVSDDSVASPEKSPWRTPQNCFWPVDDDDELLCALPEQPGHHQCPSHRTCGSDYDAYGNPRFVHPRAMHHALFVSSLDYGYTTFDNVGKAFLTIFQSITQEGWTTIMYMTMDSTQPIAAGAFFVILIMFGSFFVMNLTLAVISEEFNLDENSRGPTASEKKALLLLAAEERANFKPRIPWLYAIVSHPAFSALIMSAICANTAVLAMDNDKITPRMDTDLEIANFCLSCIFLIEMIAKLIGLGLRQYARDRFNLFDAFIVTMSVLETCISRPSFMSDNSASRGSFSALRSFRLFRVFKLARNWRSLRELLEMVRRAVASIANFAVLLFLFIYIYALMGLQLFGNTMRFDSEGYLTPTDDVKFWQGTVPRNNFDSLLWSAITVFQIITGENWNNVMYDGMRGNGFGASVYFISLVIFGNMVLMNLFLALLLDNFSSNDEEEIKAKEEETKKLAQKMSSMKVTPIAGSQDRISSTASVLDARRSRTSIAEMRQSRASMIDGNHILHPRHLPDVDEGDEDARIVDLEELDKELQRRSSLVKMKAANRTPGGNNTERATSMNGSMVMMKPTPGSIQPSMEAGDSNEEQSSTQSKPTAEMQTKKSATSVSMIRSKTSKMLLALNMLLEEIDGPDKHAAPIPASSAQIVNDPPDDRRSETPHGNDVEQEEENVPFVPAGPVGRSLFLFDEHNRVRQLSFNWIHHPYFDSTILLLITISSITLAMDNPLMDTKSSLSKVLSQLDIVFTTMFTAEMIVKIIALGLVMHKGAYLRSTWNILDGVIVILSLVMLGMQSSSPNNSSSLKSLRSLRMLRTFRPLRMISRRPGLKLVVNSLIEAIPAVLNVLFLCGLLYLIFSIVAVNNLKGLFYSCKGDNYDNLSREQKAFLETARRSWSNLTDTEREWFATNETCHEFGHKDVVNVTSRYVCECFNATWRETIPQNFNNVGRAMLTFFEISTTEGWADVMVTAIDATEVDMQPSRNKNMIWALFFIVFIMVGSFFVVNLFVGVIIDNFNSMKAALGGDFMLTPEQRKWIEAQKAASRVGPVRVLKPSKHPVRRAIFFFVQHQRFEWTVMICIIANTVLMGTQYFGQSSAQTSAMDALNYFFTAVFTAEAVLKLIAYGYAYFEDKWSQFDFGVVAGTLTSILIEELTKTRVRSLLMIVRVIRVTRVLRLVKASKGIRHILLTLYISLPGLSNIASILLLMLFIYSTMGVQMFATVALTDNIDSHANFQSFGTAFLFLMRAATGEAWNACMHDLASRPKDCVDNRVYDANMCGYTDDEDCVELNGCGTPFAFVFFCSFTLLVTYVLLNVTIAVILEGFSLSHEDEEPLFEPELLQEFQSKWCCVDPRATGFVRVARVWALVALLEPPLVKTEVATSKNSFLQYARGLQLPLYEGETVFFTEVLLAMTREMVKETVAADPNAIGDVAPPMEELPSRLRLEFQAHEYFAVCRIQRSVAEWLRFKRQLEKQYMEEYKNKIKKPSGRPKKQRDARVFTIG